MGRKRAIICFETEERFESVTDAANAIGAAWSLVSSALKMPRGMSRISLLLR